MPKDIREWTDNELAKMERKIQRIYRTSAKDIKSKWDDFMKEAGAELKPLQNAYDDAVKSGDEKLIKEASKNLSQAQKEVTLQNDYYKEMIDETTLQLAHVNQTAVSYMNGQVPSIYTNNYNDLRYDADNLGIMFNIQNEETVRNLMNQGEIELPKRKLEVPKDRRWNRKQLNSSVLQGIIQGESMDEIAKRILPVVDRNEASAIRNARTMVTGAENKGKQDSFKELQKQGAVLVQIWSAVGDSRTRDWHLSMDGQERELDEKFVDGIGNELRFPGDPRAEDGATIYNCRCAIKTRIIGFRKADGRIEYVNYERGKELSLHDKQIIEERQKRLGAKAPQQKVVNGKDISGTWVRRSDKFDFAIEDVINAQGFDGKPRVVSREEFDKAVKQANDGNGFIAQRTYSAPDQETLDAYRQQLYEGKWYVDCSTGGAQYGQGMYCAADYTGTLTDGIKSEMEHYASQYRASWNNTPKQFSMLEHDEQNNELIKMIRSKYPRIQQDDEYKMLQFIRNGAGVGADVPVEKLVEYMSDLNKFGLNDIMEISQEAMRKTFGGSPNYIETMTLDPSAKIISYVDLGDLRQKEISDNLSLLPDLAISGNTSEIKRINDYAKKINDMDYGSYAAMKGYDAINAVGHGASSSYTVILNRTKVIILGE